MVRVDGKLVDRRLRDFLDTDGVACGVITPGHTRDHSRELVGASSCTRARSEDAKHRPSSDVLEREVDAVRSLVDGDGVGSVGEVALADLARHGGRRVEEADSAALGCDVEVL